jgi:uncharacterized protein
MRPTAEQLIEKLKLAPLPVEGGLFVQTWRGQPAAGGKPAGTATYAMLTDDPDSFSAMHRLPTDEIWHFYLGDPIRLLLLGPDRSIRRIVLGQDIIAGQTVQAIVPAGTWMGGRLLPGGRYGLFGNTMAPGFTETDYAGGSADLAELYPEAAEEILALIRPGEPTVMPHLG